MATRKKTTAAPKPRKNALGGELKPVKRSRKTTKAKPSQPTEKKEQTSSPRPGLSLLEAAHQILQQASEPKTCRQLVEAAAKQGLWSSPAGKTPHNTLYTSILREINTQGEASRFVKIDRGQFTTTGK
ncbi:winged helix-turn-helix domain-containing protein [uncultured Rubinisphaera sp.]|uniref:winged helix-turn-helix domain-containing protein n=1 Tax=uncultured Rubinisphaera sp. TaxID=1678686 RepID=UPI0030DB897D